MRIQPCPPRSAVRLSEGALELRFGTRKAIVYANGFGWRQFLNGFACGERNRKERVAVNSYQSNRREEQ